MLTVPIYTLLRQLMYLYPIINLNLLLSPIPVRTLYILFAYMAALDFSLGYLTC